MLAHCGVSSASGNFYDTISFDWGQAGDALRAAWLGSVGGLAVGTLVAFYHGFMIFMTHSILTYLAGLVAH
jgi:hypothetical protein